MKSLETYIWESQLDEGLLSGFVNFFKKIFKAQTEIGEKGEKIKIDIKQLKRSKNPVDFQNLETTEYKKLLSDKKAGFPILNEFVKNPKKFLPKDFDTNQAKTFLHFQKLKKSAVQAGVLMFTEKPSLRQGEAFQLLCIESSLIIDNKNEVNKAMLELWVNDIKKKNKEITYIIAEPTHPKMSGILTSIGFTADKANKEIYIYTI